MIETRRIRDLMVEAAIEALIRIRYPGISSCEIQRRGSMQIHEGYYYILIDDEPVCRIDLHERTVFEVTIL